MNHTHKIEDKNSNLLDSLIFTKSSEYAHLTSPYKANFSWWIWISIDERFYSFDSDRSTRWFLLNFQ